MREELLVLAVVALAAGLFARRLYRTLTSRPGSAQCCGCGANAAGTCAERGTSPGATDACCGPCEDADPPATPRAPS